MPEIHPGKPGSHVKNPVDPFVPYHFLQEQEPDTDGTLIRVNTLFLSSKECSFQCIMCDLWKNTLEGNTPLGAIAKQMDYASARLPQAEVIKLYNSGNFFDQKAVPPQDYPDILSRLKGYQRVIVENHPKLCGDLCLEFNEQLEGKFEIAMGLETVHPEALLKLNKQITPVDFRNASVFLNKNGIDVRAFILFNLPHVTSQKENSLWTLKSILFAFESGAKRCILIPTRPGTFLMKSLFEKGLFVLPVLHELENVFDIALDLKQGQVFIDTWDLDAISQCSECFEARKQRLELMNLHQKIYPRITCHSCSDND
jgi:archaeosine synthase beta-subunit